MKDRTLLQASGWFSSPGKVAHLDLHPLTALRFSILQAIGHPLFGDAIMPDREVETCDILDYLYVASASTADLASLPADSREMARAVRDESAALGDSLPLSALDETVALMEGEVKKLLAAAAETIPERTGDGPGKPPCSEAMPSHTSSPASSTTAGQPETPPEPESCSTACPSPASSNSSTPETTPTEPAPNGATEPEAPEIPCVPPPSGSPQPAPDASRLNDTFHHHKMFFRAAGGVWMKVDVTCWRAQNMFQDSNTPVRVPLKDVLNALYHYCE